jgi:hypothetical protein
MSEHSLAPPPWSSLPLLAPPRSAWPGLQAELDRRTRRRRTTWLSLAAAILIAILLPRLMTSPPTPVSASAVAPTAKSAEAAALGALMTESAQLEALIAWSRDEDVEAMSAASLAIALEERIERVDLLLSRPDADPAARVPLWQERVLRLRQLAGLHSAQHLLAANGDVEPGMPVLAF